MFKFISRRSIAEQFAGLGIILLTTTLFAAMNIWSCNHGATWLHSMNLAPWALSNTDLLTVIAHVVLALSFWSIWRIESMRTLHLELTLFSSLFIFEFIWCISLFTFHELLLALISLLLWMSLTFLLTALFWKKEKVAGGLMAISLIWIVYLVSTTMMLCIKNP